jgi:hypothetical protein
MVGRKENGMALEILFKSDVGLLSLFTILFMLCMGIFMYFFVRSRIRKEERSEKLAR